MTKTEQDTEISEYPSGIQQREGGPVPLPLKLTYVGFVLFGIIYFIRYRFGDGTPLVAEFNGLLKAAGAP